MNIQQRIKRVVGDLAEVERELAAELSVTSPHSAWIDAELSGKLKQAVDTTRQLLWLQAGHFECGPKQVLDRYRLNAAVQTLRAVRERRI
jgi:hypothetical protein